MDIRIADHAGTCFGVRRAIQAAFESARQSGGKNIFIKGDIVHNPQIVSELERLGVKKIDDVGELSSGHSLIIRGHGEEKHVYEHCEKNGIRVIDTTCPYVKEAQDKAVMLEEEGYRVVIFGDASHPEVRSIASRTHGAIVISDASQADACLENLGKTSAKVGVISQTTQPPEKFLEIVSRIKEVCADTKACNTICNATQRRQDAARKLCDEVDMMIVIGGRNSSNTKRLYELSSRKVETYWIENPEEIDPLWFCGKERVGVTAGASTPDYEIKKACWMIESISQKDKGMCLAQAKNEAMMDENDRA